MMDQFNKLDNYESRFSDQVWAGVSQHLETQKKQKRTRRLLYIGSATIVFLSIIVGYSALYDDVFDPIETITPQEEMLVMADSPKTSVQKGATYSQETLINTSESSKSLDIDPVQSILVDDIAVVESEFIESQIHNSTQIEITSLEKSNLSQSNVERTGVSNNLKQTGSQALSVNKERNRLKSRVKPQVESVTDLSPSRMLAEVDQLNQVNRLNSDYSIKSLFIKEGCNLLDASPFKTYVWSQISAFAPVSNHSAKLTQHDDYNAARKSTEKALISPEFGFGLGVRSKAGLFLESGFQFAYYRERLGYIDPESINVQTIITTDSIFVNGEVEVKRDTTTIQIPGSREVVNYNTHKTVSVPLIVGFDKYLGSSWSFGGKVGAIFNLLKQSEGKILSEDMVVSDIIHNEGSSVDVYKTRMTTQLLLGTQFRYHFSPSLDVYISGDVRFNAKSITLDEYSLSQRFTTPVLGAGMRYYF